MKAADRYLLDQVRERLGLRETVAAILKMTAKWPKAATEAGGVHSQRTESDLGAAP